MGGIERAGVETPTWFREPSYGQRFGGMVIDALLIALLGGIMISIVGESRAGTAASLVVSFAYAVAFTGSSGRTPGKIAMGTCVVGRTSADLPTWRQASVRWLTLIGASIVSLAVPAVGVIAPVYGISVLSGPLHQGFHDRASDTLVTSVRSDR
ncbi:MAG: RDD family protein [Actinomycetota bacterium]|nr:RDD family protein [Actinomycetota bacterium]